MFDFGAVLVALGFLLLFLFVLVLGFCLESWSFRFVFPVSGFFSVFPFRFWPRCVRAFALWLLHILVACCLAFSLSLVL